MASFYNNELTLTTDQADAPDSQTLRIPSWANAFAIMIRYR